MSINGDRVNTIDEESRSPTIDPPAARQLDDPAYVQTLQTLTDTLSPQVIADLYHHSRTLSAISDHTGDDDSSSNHSLHDPGDGEINSGRNDQNKYLIVNNGNFANGPLSDTHENELVDEFNRLALVNIDELPPSTSRATALPLAIGTKTPNDQLMKALNYESHQPDPMLPKQDTAFQDFVLASREVMRKLNISSQLKTPDILRDGRDNSEDPVVQVEVAATVLDYMQKVQKLILDNELGCDKKKQVPVSSLPRQHVAQNIHTSSANRLPVQKILPSAPHTRDPKVTGAATLKLDTLVSTLQDTLHALERSQLLAQKTTQISPDNARPTYPQRGPPNQTQHTITLDDDIVNLQPTQQDVDSLPVSSNIRTFQSNFNLGFYQRFSLIPRFDGTPDKLNPFCSAVRNILTIFGPECESTLRDALIEKFQGQASASLSSAISRCRSIEEFLTNLEREHSNVAAADGLLAQIKVVNQRQNETAAQYGSRVLQLNNRIQAIYASNADISPGDRSYLTRTSEDEALQQFMFGLRPPLNHQVLSRQPRTLDEAIRFAIEFENRQCSRLALAMNLEDAVAPAAPLETLLPNANVMYASASQVCNYCGGTNHVETNCQKKRRETLFCDYCKKPGHVFASCRTLRYHLNTGRAGAALVANSSNQNNSTQQAQAPNYTQDGNHQQSDQNSVRSNRGRGGRPRGRRFNGNRSGNNGTIPGNNQNTENPPPYTPPAAQNAVCNPNQLPAAQNSGTPLNG